MPLQDLYPLTAVEDSADQTAGIRVNRSSGPDAQIFWDENTGRWLFGREGSENAFQIARTLETVSTDFEVTAEDQNKLFVVQTDGEGELLTATLSGENIPVGTTVDFLNNGSGGFDFRGAIGEGVNRIGSVVQGEFIQATWTGNRWAIEGGTFTSGLNVNFDVGDSYQSQLTGFLINKLYDETSDKIILTNDNGDFEIIDASTLTQIAQSTVPEELFLGDFSFEYFPENDIFLGSTEDFPDITIYAIDGNTASVLDTTSYSFSSFPRNEPVNFVRTGESDSSTGEEYGLVIRRDAVYSCDVSDLSNTFTNTGISLDTSGSAEYFPSLGKIVILNFELLEVIDVTINGLTVTENARRSYTPKYQVSDVISVNKQNNRIVWRGSNSNFPNEPDGIEAFDVENETFDKAPLVDDTVFFTPCVLNQQISIADNGAYDIKNFQVLANFEEQFIDLIKGPKTGNTFFYLDDTSSIREGSVNKTFADLSFERSIVTTLGSPLASRTNYKIPFDSERTKIRLNSSQSQKWSGTVYNNTTRTIKIIEDSDSSGSQRLSDVNEPTYILPRGTCEIEYNGDFWQVSGDVAFVEENSKVTTDNFYPAENNGLSLVSKSPTCYNPTDELVYIGTGDDFTLDFDGVFTQDLSFENLEILPISGNVEGSTRAVETARSRGTAIVLQALTRSAGSISDVYIEEFRDNEKLNSFSFQVPFIPNSDFGINYNEIDQELYFVFTDLDDSTSNRLYVFDLETQAITTDVALSNSDFPDIDEVVWNEYLQALVTNGGRGLDRQGNKINSINFDFDPINNNPSRIRFGRSLNPKILVFSNDIFNVKTEEFLLNPPADYKQNIDRSESTSNIILDPRIVSYEGAIVRPPFSDSSNFLVNTFYVDDDTIVGTSEEIPVTVSDISNVPDEVQKLPSLPKISYLTPKRIDSTSNYTTGVWDMERGVDIQNIGNTMVNIPIDSNSRFDTGDTVEIENTGGGVVQFMGEFNPSTGEEAVITTEASYVLDSDAEVTLRKTAPNMWRLESDDLYTYDGTNYIKS